MEAKTKRPFFSRPSLIDAAGTLCITGGVIAFLYVLYVALNEIFSIGGVFVEGKGAYDALMFEIVKNLELCDEFLKGNKYFVLVGLFVIPAVLVVFRAASIYEAPTFDS